MVINLIKWFQLIRTFASYYFSAMPRESTRHVCAMNFAFTAQHLLTARSFKPGLIAVPES